MGLFNTSSRLSFGNSNTTRRERRRKVKSYAEASEAPGTICVDVGERETFDIKITHANRFDILSEGPTSLVVKVSYNNNSESEVLKVHWADTQRDSCDRDHVPSLMMSDYVMVPQYRSKETYRHYNTFVTVGIRSYIKGHTLSSVLSVLPDEDFDTVLEQIQGVIWKLGEKQSLQFGHIQYDSLRTATPAAYVSTLVMIDKLTSKLDANDWTEEGKDMYRCPAVMCHGDLSPEHIILRNTTVVGIVGWSRGDFVPEVYDRLKYYFRSNPKDPRCWYRRMSEITMNVGSGRPSVEFILNATKYVYIRQWRAVPERQRSVVTTLYKALRTNYTTINCLALATEVEGDNMSLSSLTSWWNESTITVTQ